MPQAHPETPPLAHLPSPCRTRAQGLSQSPAVALVPRTALGTRQVLNIYLLNDVKKASSETCTGAAELPPEGHGSQNSEPLGKMLRPPPGRLLHFTS